MPTKRNRCAPATTQVLPHRKILGCAAPRRDGTPTPYRSSIGLSARTSHQGSRRSGGPPCGVFDPSPWMKSRVDQLMRLLADQHGISIPRSLIRAELADYLTTFSYLYRVSRFEARLCVTEEMLRASAREIAEAHAALIRSVAR